MSSLDEEYIALNWKWGVDKKSEDSVKTSTTNMISLIADLAIISKVAGEALGNMWSGLQDAVTTSLESLDDVNIGLNAGIDPKDLLALQYAVGQIGGTNKDVNTMVNQADAVIQSFRNKATGVGELKKFFEKNAVYNLTADTVKGLEEAIGNKDAVKLLKLFGETRNELGDEFSNFVKDIGLSGLANLENPKQYEDWLAAWERSTSRLNEIDFEGVDDLSDAVKNFKKAAEALKIDFAGDIGRDLKDLSESILGVTETYLLWKDSLEKNPQFKQMSESANKLLFGDASLPEDATTLDKAENWTGNFADYFLGLAGLILKDDYIPKGGSPGLVEYIKNIDTVTDNVKYEEFQVPRVNPVNADGTSTGFGEYGNNNKADAVGTVFNFSGTTIVADNPEEFVGEAEILTRSLQGQGFVQ